MMMRGIVAALFKLLPQFEQQFAAAAFDVA
jgi:hypothetical protein